MDGLRTWEHSFGLTNVSQQTVADGSGNRYVTNKPPDGSSVVSHFQFNRLLSTTRKDSAGVQIGQTVYTYDPHGRQATATDARNGTTSYTYDTTTWIA